MADISKDQFLQAITDFGKEVNANAEAIRGWSQYIDEEAGDTARVGEMIAAKRVDSDTVAETHELARIMRGVSEQAIQYAATADTTARLATASHDEVMATHQGIGEQVNASTAPGIYDVDNDWLAKE
jgi:hypothetical protein